MSEPHKVSEPKKYGFLVMDGRARLDMDRATVIDFMEEEANYERVWYEFIREYADYDYCLVVAEITGINTLKLLRVIDSLKDLEEL